MNAVFVSMNIKAHGPSGPLLCCHCHGVRHAHLKSGISKIWRPPRNTRVSTQARKHICMAVNESETETKVEQREEAPPARKGKRRQAGSTDFIASNLTRRFGYYHSPTLTYRVIGIRPACMPPLPTLHLAADDLRQCLLGDRLAGGLIWLGILTFGVVSEQIKTRIEDNQERNNTKVCLTLSLSQNVQGRQLDLIWASSIALKFLS